MREEEFNENLKEGKVEYLGNEENIARVEKEEPLMDQNLESFMAQLVKLRRIKQHFTSAPIATRKAKDFVDQFYLYKDSSGSTRVYMEIDAAWLKIYDSTQVGKSVQLIVIPFGEYITIGDGKTYFHIDSRLNGMNLVDVHAEVFAVGTTGTLDIQIRNVTQTQDMLSTKLTIDSGESGSDTAATPAVIDTDKDDVATNDVIAIDVDAIHTGEASRGLVITLGFETP